MSRVLRVGHIDLSFHAATAAVVQAILEEHGHRVETSAAPHEEMFQRYARDEVDLLVSAWLPASHGRYLAPSLERTTKLGVLYRPFCIWGVPDYVPQDEVNEISDLLKPQVLDRMERRIQGINPGAGISRFSVAMVEAYGLDAAGYHFRPGSESECFDGFERAVSEQRWLVIPLWHPQYLHYRHRIRALAEPKQLLGGTDDATLIIRNDVKTAVDPEALKRLSTLSLGNEVVTMLDYQIRKAGQSALDAAKDWLASASLKA